MKTSENTTGSISRHETMRLGTTQTEIDERFHTKLTEETMKRHARSKADLSMDLKGKAVKRTNRGDGGMTTVKRATQEENDDLKLRVRR